MDQYEKRPRTRQHPPMNPELLDALSPRFDGVRSNPPLAKDRACPTRRSHHSRRASRRGEGFRGLRKGSLGTRHSEGNAD
jgi:hypothetical protein